MNRTIPLNDCAATPVTAHLDTGHLHSTPASPLVSLVAQASKAVRHAARHAYGAQREDGHWCAELESNCTVTAEYVFMCQALGLDLSDKREAIVRYVCGKQKSDGSWGIAWNHEGDVSTTAECYLALRLLGVEVEDPRLQRAQIYILANGGLETIRVFTRINFAMFGLFPWSAVPSLPAELILLPTSNPINVYSFSSWARGTIVPLLVLFRYKPVYPLPNGITAENDWLDHLWRNPKNKRIPYAKPLLDVVNEHRASWKSVFAMADVALATLEKLQRTPLTRLRAAAVERCMAWILERQEEDGDWAGIFPPMLNGVLAMYAHGMSLDSPPLQKALRAMERFGFRDDSGFRIEACQSPIWDTTLMMIALHDSGAAENRLAESRRWMLDRQILQDYGDWKISNRAGKPGGWSFEYANTWYPDVDDTAAVIIALLKDDPASASSDAVRKAVDWVVSMQNADGGWAAFDKGNDKVFLNEIPFSDMDSLCDPSTPDIVGRVLEAFGILRDPRLDEVCARGISYLRASQEPEGSWFGRWGVNYIYGTSNVLCALGHHPISARDPMVRRALDWLKSVQNADGGWGECLESYRDRTLMGRGRSTASQTAWALMGLLAYLPAEDPAVRRGIEWLVVRQNGEGSWEEEEFTGTGFPKHFYLRYHLYRHYFPMMALGRFLHGQRTS